MGETSCPSLRGLWVETWVLVFLLLLTSVGTLDKLCNFSEPQFCHLSPTCNKYLLAPREVFDLLRENYIEWNMLAINYPIFSFFILSVSHGGDLLFFVAPWCSFKKYQRRAIGSPSLSLPTISYSLSGGSSAPFIPCPLFLWGSHNHMQAPAMIPKTPPKLNSEYQRLVAAILPVEILSS